MSHPPDNERLSPRREPTDRELNLLSEILEIQRLQVSIQQQENEHSHEYAKLALNAQTKDQEAERLHSLAVQRHRLIFAGVVLFLILVFVALAMYWNKDQLALELLKNFGLLVAGGLGGYGLRSIKAQREESDE